MHPPNYFWCSTLCTHKYFPQPTSSGADRGESIEERRERREEDRRERGRREEGEEIGPPGVGGGSSWPEQSEWHLWDCGPWIPLNWARHRGWWQRQRPPGSGRVGWGPVSGLGQSCGLWQRTTPLSVPRTALWVTQTCRHSRHLARCIRGGSRAPPHTHPIELWERNLSHNSIGWVWIPYNTWST